MLKTKRWVQFPNSNVLINVNSAATLLGFSKDKIYDTSSLVENIKNFRTDVSLNSFKTVKISEASYKKLMRRFFWSDSIKTPNNEGRQCQLRFDSSKRKMYIYELGEKPYGFSKTDLEMNYLFSNVWIVKDLKNNEYYIDFGPNGSIDYIQKRAFWDKRGIPHNQSKPNTEYYTKTISQTPAEISNLKNVLIKILNE